MDSMRIIYLYLYDVERVLVRHLLNTKIFFGWNFLENNAKANIDASGGIISANSGPLNTVKSACNAVYVIETTKIEGNVFNTFKPSIINISKNGIKEVNKG